MGQSSDFAEVRRKVAVLRDELGNTRRPLEAAALAAVKVYRGSPIVGHRVARKRITARYDLFGKDLAVVRFKGPAHLALNPTKPHEIGARRRPGAGRRRGRGKQALHFDGRFATRVQHPGTRGKDPGARRVKAAAIPAAAKAYAETGLREAMRRSFGG